MTPKIHLHIEHLHVLIEDYCEETLEQIRDEALLLADSIEEYVYQRDAERMIRDFLAEVTDRS